MFFTIERVAIMFTNVIASKKISAIVMGLTMTVLAVTSLFRIVDTIDMVSDNNHVESTVPSDRYEYTTVSPNGLACRYTQDKNESEPVAVACLTEPPRQDEHPERSIYTDESNLSVGENDSNKIVGEVAVTIQNG